MVVGLPDNSPVRGGAQNVSFQFIGNAFQGNAASVGAIFDVTKGFRQRKSMTRSRYSRFGLPEQQLTNSYGGATSFPCDHDNV